MSKSLVCASFTMAAPLAIAGCAYNSGPTTTGSTAMGPALVDARARPFLPDIQPAEQYQRSYEPEVGANNRHQPCGLIEPVIS